jgi:hypothetical protein
VTWNLALPPQEWLAAQQQQKQGEGYDVLMEQYQTCDVLVFDDLGAEKLMDRVEEQLYLLVDYPYRQRLPLFVSSNHCKEALAQRLDRWGAGPAAGACTMLEVTGPNLRDRAVKRVGRWRLVTRRIATWSGISRCLRSLAPPRGYAHWNWSEGYTPTGQEEALLSFQQTYKQAKALDKRPPLLAILLMVHTC